jgi:hypothetical protein
MLGAANNRTPAVEFDARYLVMGGPASELGHWAIGSTTGAGLPARRRFIVDSSRLR